MSSSSAPSKRLKSPMIWMLLAIAGSALGSTACTTAQIAACRNVPESLTSYPAPEFQKLGPEATRREQLAEVEKTERDRRRARRRLAIIEAQQNACRE